MKQKILTLSYYSICTVLIVVVFYITSTWLLPCVISLLIVVALQPVIANIVKKIGIENKVMLFIVTIIVYIVIIGLLLYLIFLGMIQIYFLLEKLPSYLEEIYVFIDNNETLHYLNEYAGIFYESIQRVIQNCSLAFIDYLLAFISKIPSYAFDTMFVVISSLFFILDYDNIKIMILKYSKKEEETKIIIRCIKETISNVFKAYFFIFLITFIALLCSFYIIRLEDALMLAFVIAIFDFLPILGHDMVFIPWIVIVAFKNQVGLALQLLVVYIIITIIKNIIEPKLISKHVGMHPLLTIVSMFIGLKFLGMLGMVVMPLVIMVGQRLYLLNKEE